MELQTTFESLDAEIAYLRNKPLDAASPKELEQLLKDCFNRIYELTQPVTRQKRAAQALRTVSILGQLTESRVHVNHFDFRKKALGIDTLVWELTLTRWTNREPDEVSCKLFEQSFPFLYKGLRGGYGNMIKDVGYEMVYQFSVPLSMFPKMMETVRRYHAELLEQPYCTDANQKRQQRYPGFAYLCRA